MKLTNKQVLELMIEALQTGNDENLKEDFINYLNKKIDKFNYISPKELERQMAQANFILELTSIVTNADHPLTCAEIASFYPTMTVQKIASYLRKSNLYATRDKKKRCNVYSVERI